MQGHGWAPCYAKCLRWTPGFLFSFLVFVSPSSFPKFKRKSYPFQLGLSVCDPRITPRASSLFLPAPAPATRHPPLVPFGFSERTRLERISIGTKGKKRMSGSAASSFVVQWKKFAFFDKTVVGDPSNSAIPNKDIQVMADIPFPFTFPNPNSLFFLSFSFLL